MKEDTTIKDKVIRELAQFITDTINGETSWEAVQILPEIVRIVLDYQFFVSMDKSE